MSLRNMVGWLGYYRKVLIEQPNYNSTHQGRGDHKDGGVSIDIHKSLDFTVKPDLSINNNDIKSLAIEILLDKKRNTLINALYRSPNGQIESFEKFLNNLFSKIKNQTNYSILLVVLIRIYLTMIQKGKCRDFSV